MSVRTRLADEVVRRLQIELGAKPLGTVVHWVDCDEDDRKFWLHIVPEYLSPPGRLGTTKTIGRILSRAIPKIADYIYQHTPYTMEHSREQSPQGLYSKAGGYSTFQGYLPNFWIYQIAFYGGATQKQHE